MKFKFKKPVLRRNKSNSRKSSKKRFNKEKVFSSIFLILFTAFILAATLVALPQVDKFLNESSYDLIKKDDDYWRGEYILELQLKEGDMDDQKVQIEQTANIIHRRLQRFGVEESKVVYHTYTDESGEAKEYTPAYLRVVVQTTKQQDLVERLIGTRYFIRFHEPKEGVDFDNPDDQLAPYMMDNYTPTDFTRSSFRNVLIKKLPTNDGSEAYFAIFKPWPHTAGAFNSFMKENVGGKIGYEVDEFVTPISVPVEFAYDRGASQQQGQSNSQRAQFTIGVAQTADEAQVYDLLFNEGQIPLKINVADSEVLDAEINEMEVIDILLAVVAGVIAIIIFTGVTKRGLLIQNITFAISMLLIVSTWVAYLKMSETPVDLWLMLLEGISLIMIVYVLTYYRHKRYFIEALLLGTMLLLSIVSDGYARLFSQTVLALSAFAVVAVPLTKEYIIYMKRFIIK